MGAVAQKGQKEELDLLEWRCVRLWAALGGYWGLNSGPLQEQ